MFVDCSLVLSVACVLSVGGYLMSVVRCSFSLCIVGYRALFVVGCWLLVGRCSLFDECVCVCVLFLIVHYCLLFGEC